MAFTLLHLCACLVFWWYFWPILAEGLSAALGAFFGELLTVLGSCFVSVALLAWGICFLVAVAGHGVRRVR